MRVLVADVGWLSWVALCSSLVGGVGCTSDASSAVGSPTGTTLVPRNGLDATGYSVIDEVCGDVSSSGYLRRFETPMFRAVAVVNEIAYLLDGSLLWAVDITQPKAPKRVSLTRLPGHPLSLAIGSNNRLWIAAGESGLLGVDIANPAAPDIRVRLPVAGAVLDVEWSNGRGYLALGEDGISSFSLDAEGAPFPEHRVTVSSFVADVEVENGILYVAACDQVAAYALAQGGPPRFQSSRRVPSGHGRRVTVDNGTVYVSAGEALYAYGTRTDGQLRALGAYSDRTIPGFYVNHFVVLGDKGFIAAGDESVRVVDLGELTHWDTSAELRPGQTPRDLDEPLDLAIPTVRVWSGDPIAVGLNGTALLVLGNFRWVGERLLTILDTTDPVNLPEIGRYGQPEQFASVDHASGAAQIRVQDSNGTKFLITQELEVAGRWEFGLARQWVTIGDNLGYVSDDGELYWALRATAMMLHGAVGDDLVAIGDRFIVGTRDNNALASFDNEGYSPASKHTFAEGLGLIGQARLGTNQGLLLAYDWVLGILHVFQSLPDDLDVLTQSYDVGLCENYDWADLFSGASEFRARFVETPTGFALLCPSDENHWASLHPFVRNESGGFDQGVVLPLPTANYADVIATNEGWALATFDNGRYISELLLVDPNGGGIERHPYDGHAKGLFEVRGGYIVFDNDRGPLRYDLKSRGLQPVALPGLEGSIL